MQETTQPPPPNPEPQGALPQEPTRETPGSKLISRLLLLATGIVLGAGCAGMYLWVAAALLTAPRIPRVALAEMPSQLLVTSDPDGAMVTIDGEELGPTPLLAAALKPGFYRVVLSADDYVASIETIRLEPASEQTHHVRLRLLPARLALRITADNPRILVDGRLTLSLEGDVEVEPGERLIRIEAEGYQAWERLLALRVNEQRSLEIALRRAWPDVEAGVEIFPLAVMVENQADARPQSGLDRADIVYEALAEGGITRFLALYATDQPTVVGPVRSARHYFVDWAKEYGAPLVHIGASPQGYSELRARRVASVEETAGGAIWRSRARPAPHNAYTSVEAARQSLGSRAPSAGSFGGLIFKNETLSAGEGVATNAMVRYGAWDYRVEWSYDLTNNSYSRSVDGQPHLDAESREQISVANVVVQWMDSWLIDGDSAGRLDYAQTGSGRFIALTDGTQMAGTWSKRSLDSATRYLSGDGSPLLFNQGPTWIHILPSAGSLRITPAES